MEPRELASMLRHIADRVEQVSPDCVTWEMRRSWPSRMADDVLGDDLREPINKNEYWDISVTIAPEEAV